MTEATRRPPDPARTPSHRIFSAPILLQLLLLVWLIGLLTTTLGPGYRGGGFIVIVVAATAAALALAIVLEILSRRPARSADATGGDDQPATRLLTAVRPIEWSGLLRVVGFSLLLVGSVTVFGVYLGTTSALAWSLRRHCSASWWFAAAFAVIVGALLPFAFAEIMSIRLWPGALPEIVPGFLGGGILPPL